MQRFAHGRWSWTMTRRAFFAADLVLLLALLLAVLGFDLEISLVWELSAFHAMLSLLFFVISAASLGWGCNSPGVWLGWMTFSLALVPLFGFFVLWTLGDSFSGLPYSRLLPVAAALWFSFAYLLVFLFFALFNTALSMSSSGVPEGDSP